MGGVADFAELHKGGFIANVAKGVKPLTRQGDYVEAYGEENEEMVKKHLEGDANIGVYPLWQKNGVWMVNWGAVDLDDGEISYVHATNLQKLLTKMGITSWKEPSRSKGVHVWVYLQAPMAASLVRQALIGACRIVDVPIREVYPKQISLEKGSIGNCLRLPYPGGRTPGKQEIEGYSWQKFTKEALENRTPPAMMRKLLPLHAATEPKKLKYVDRGFRLDGEFLGLAKELWEQSEHEDRSKSLFGFATSLIWQEFTVEATLDWVRRFDDRLEKFTGRADRERQLRNLVERAVTAIGDRRA